MNIGQEVARWQEKWFDGKVEKQGGVKREKNSMGMEWRNENWWCGAWWRVGLMVTKLIMVHKFCEGHIWPYQSGGNSGFINTHINIGRPILCFQQHCDQWGFITSLDTFIPVWIHASVLVLSRFHSYRLIFFFFFFSILIIGIRSFLTWISSLWQLSQSGSIHPRLVPLLIVWEIFVGLRYFPQKVTMHAWATWKFIKVTTTMGHSFSLVTVPSRPWRY